MSDNPRRPSNTLRTVFSFNADDLTTSSVEQKYPLGTILSLSGVEPNPLDTASSVSNVETKYIYLLNKFGINEFRPGIIEHSVEIGEEYFIRLPDAAITTASVLCAIPQIQIPTGQYGFFLIEGYGKAHVKGDGVNIDKDDYLVLDISDGGNRLQKQTVNPTRVDVNTRAKSNSNNTVTLSDPSISIYLIARQGGVRA